MNYGYIRVSTISQNLDRQLEDMYRQGLSDKQIFADKQSGKDFERKNYQRLKRKLKVGDGTFLMVDSGARYIEINSALVSAQNRQRFYVHNCGEVDQPEDRGILLKDILETTNAYGTLQTDKSRTMTASYSNKSTRDFVQDIVTHGQLGATGVLESLPVGVTDDGKSFCLTSSYAGAVAWNTIERNQRSMVAEQTEGVE